MSAPFDPTKLDLDITKQNTPEPESQEKYLNEASQDILDEITISEKVSESASTPKQAIQTSDDILGEIENSDTGMQEIASVEEEQKDTEKQEERQDQENHDTTGHTGGESINAKGEEKKKLIDINISSLEDIVLQLHDREYDYVILEPEEMQVKVSFRQDNVERDIKYIKFPTYTNILFKTKQSTKLIIEDTGSPQEGKGKIKIGDKIFALLSKTSPGQNGEKIFIKVKEIAETNTKKENKKAPLGKIFGFLAAILFIALVLFGTFISFVVFNANTVSDVEFFRSLGINLGEINRFIENLVGIIFSILLFISTATLSFALFKFLLTKKTYKRKKLVYSLLSVFLLLITIGIATAWMTVYNKVQALPNWLEKERGNLQIFDNTLLVSDDFSQSDAYLESVENLIGPVTLKFDLNNFANDRSNQIFNIKKYIWDVGDERIETISPELIYTFTDVKNYEITITVEGEDNTGEEITQVIDSNTAISLSHTIEIQETITNNGGKRYEFDAQNLENLGEVSWYLYEPSSENNPNPSYENWTQVADGYRFIPRKIFFEEAYVGIAIINGNTKEESLDKIIRLASQGVSEISGEISFEQSLENELKFDFYVTDPETGFANGFIESYEWTIEDKTYTTSGDINNTQESERVSHEFKNFGEQNIQVTLTDTSGGSQTLTQTILVQKQIKLRSSMEITNNGEKIENLKYEEKTHEYFIDNLGVPTSLKLDARYVRSENLLYSLDSVEWDIDSDGDIDGQGKVFNFEIPTEGDHNLIANYIFEHRRDSEDIIELKEKIYVEGVRKQAILDLKIEAPSNYVPVIVRFDASASFIKDDDIVKFIYDYGDGVTEERDAINPGRKYTKAGDYTIKLTVVGQSGKSYSTEKSLILLPVPQSASITSSLKKASIGQGIDFSSSESSGQIVEYFWDFGDGEISTEANPTHSYKKAGIYRVKLRADFANSNSISDEIEIEIYEAKD